MHLSWVLTRKQANMKPTWRVILWGLALLSTPILTLSETHRFTPKVFYGTYSFAHPPALRIKPGDRVITKTLDAGGSDETGKQVASIGPNPEIGPFYIEGAEPGDVLVGSRRAILGVCEPDLPRDVGALFEAVAATVAVRAAPRVARDRLAIDNDRLGITRHRGTRHDREREHRQHEGAHG